MTPGASTSTHRWTMAAMACSLLLTASPQAAAEDPPTLEYRVKAAFLFNFARFIEWPPPGHGKVFTVCVLGNDPFGSAIDEVFQGKKVRGAPLAVRRLMKAEEAGGCQAVFLSSSERKRAPQILGALAGSATLTVSDTNGFAEAGGMINFYLEDDKVRFEINAGQTAAAGFQLSSQLLRLARVVRSKQAGGR